MGNIGHLRDPVHALLALLVDGQEEEFEKIYKLNREIGLPVSLKEIEITEDEWDEIIAS